MEKRIESADNPRMKQIKKLFERKGREQTGTFLIEGERLVADAIRHGAALTCLVAADSVLVPQGADCEVLRVPARLFDTLKTTVNSQGILAVAKMPQISLSAVDFTTKRLAVYLDCISDPGNLGTIIRTADAAGADAVVLSGGCTDLYSPKVVRATMASLFAVPVFREDSYGSGLDCLIKAGFTAYAGSLFAEKSCYDMDFRGQCAFVIGNEANGISREIEARCGQSLKIPMRGGAESLNAAVACSVLLYEAVRQRLADQ